MKLAFIVQRYGAEIIGGSEYHCRLIAQRLSTHHQVEVLTTCALDYTTWKNEYAEGADRVRGVTVRRFANSKTRDLESFNRLSDWIFHNPHSENDEMEWLKQQGPWCPALIEYLKRHHTSYDSLIFFTYLYAPTVLGLRIDPSKSILVPTAHDEPAIHLNLYKETFALPAGIAYNTEVERVFLQNHFSIGASVEETVGCGVDFPQSNIDFKESAKNKFKGIAIKHDRVDDQLETDIEKSSPSDDGKDFSRRHRLYKPFALYGGRIDPGKGCEELVEYFSAYMADGGKASLVLMGMKLMSLPEEPNIRFAGLLSEQERVEALRAATVVIVPSPFESLSLLALEAFSIGTPVLANARSEVLVDHCQRSNAGLYYGDRDEFIECLKLLVNNERLRTTMGLNGREYVKHNYRWDEILSKYEQIIIKIKSGSFSGTSPRSDNQHNKDTN